MTQVLIKNAQIVNEGTITTVLPKLQILLA
jgi:hypothetical protein